MRVIVCGSRGWSNREKVANRLFDLPTDTTIVHGAARGADRIAGQEAEKLGLPVEKHIPDWDGLGKRAGFVRNELMAKLGADLLIAFWDGRSNGTRHMISMAMKYGIEWELVS